MIMPVAVMIMPVMMMPVLVMMPVLMVVMLMIMVMVMIMVMPVIVWLEKGVLEGKGHAVRRIADGTIPERLLGTQRFPVGQLMGNDHVLERICPVIEIGIATIRIAGLLGPENRAIHRGFPFLAAHKA